MSAGVGAAAGPEPGAVVAEALETVQAGLAGEPADLAALFIGEAHASAAEAIADACRTALEPRHLVGVTAGAVVAGPHELEQPDAVALWAAALPQATVAPLRYPAPSGPGLPAEWPEPPADARGLIVFADPFTFPADAFLSWLEQRGQELPVSGGLASGQHPRGNRVLLDGDVFDDGAVAIALGGDVRLRTVVSQGCRPVGETWVVTRAEQNVIVELAGAPAAERLRQTYGEADPATRGLMEQGLHIGIVFDEYQEAFGAGDFLIRAVLGADEQTGAIAVGDRVGVGQIVQFQVRDAASAGEDLRSVLDQVRDEYPAGALLFTCNGRGARLFGAPGHDAGLVSAVVGEAPLAGFFCAGEFGPVGTRSFVHGFTASVLLVG